MPEDERLDDAERERATRRVLGVLYSRKVLPFEMPMGEAALICADVVTAVVDHVGEDPLTNKLPFDGKAPCGDSSPPSARTLKEWLGRAMARVGECCDWGDCGFESKAIAWNDNQWLPVCSKHAAEAALDGHHVHTREELESM